MSSKSWESSCVIGVSTHPLLPLLWNDCAGLELCLPSNSVGSWGWKAGHR